MTKVTNLNERALLQKPGRHPVADNLFLKVLDPTHAYWVVRYSVGGVSRETSLGSARKLTRTDATGRYHAIMADVNKGVDPLTQKRRAKASGAQTGAKPTFGQCCDQYLETHQTDWRSDKHRYQWRMTLTSYAAAIRDIPVDEVKTVDILIVLKPLWTKSPAMAGKFRGRLESVIDMARALGHIDEDKANPARWKGHLDHLLPKRQRLVKGHHKAMPYADLPAFWAKLAEIDTVASRALQFTILTFARTSEVLLHAMGRGFVCRRGLPLSEFADENGQAARRAIVRRGAGDLERPNGRNGQELIRFPRQAAQAVVVDDARHAAAPDGNRRDSSRISIGGELVDGRPRRRVRTG